jgi:predicted ABC-type ATPase
VRDIYVIGGPNGAGTTTAAQTFLAGKLDTIEFVNADEIARGMSPLHPEGVAVSAGRVMLERIGSLATGDLDFAIESTLSGRSLLRFLRDCKALGW